MYLNVYTWVGWLIICFKDNIKSNTTCTIQLIFDSNRLFKLFMKKNIHIVFHNYCSHSSFKNQSPSPLSQFATKKINSQLY